MSRNNLIFFLISIAILLQIRSIVMLLTRTEPWYGSMDIPIFILTIAIFVVLLVTYKHKLIKYSFSLIFASYCLEKLAQLNIIGLDAQVFTHIIALSLLPVAFVYAFKYRKVKSDEAEMKSSQQYRNTIFIILAAIIMMIIIFIYYRRFPIGG